MIYAVTGSTGFIGRALCARLEKNGHTVVPVPKWLLLVDNLKALFSSERVDRVIHLAAYGNHYHQTDAGKTIKANIEAAMNVFKCAEGRLVDNFSTSSVTLTGKTLYSITKKCGEEIASLFPNVRTIRPYSVYGEGEAQHRLIPTVISTMINGTVMQLDEYATHDWIHIADFLDAFLNGHTEIGTGEKYTNIEIVKKLEEISGKKLKYESASLRSYDTSNWVCPNGVPHMSIEEGLLKCWKYYSRL